MAEVNLRFVGMVIDYTDTRPPRRRTADARALATSASNAAHGFEMLRPGNYDNQTSTLNILGNTIS